MNWPKFRKRPREVEAVQLVSGNRETVAEWCGGVQTWSDDLWLGVKIRTLEGDHLARPGDWVIKGVVGEFYPCADRVFRESYEPVTARPVVPSVDARIRELILRDAVREIRGIPMRPSQAVDTPEERALFHVAELARQLCALHVELMAEKERAAGLQK